MISETGLKSRAAAVGCVKMERDVNFCRRRSHTLKKKKKVAVECRASLESSDNGKHMFRAAGVQHTNRRRGIIIEKT